MNNFIENNYTFIPPCPFLQSKYCKNTCSWHPLSQKTFVRAQEERGAIGGRELDDTILQERSNEHVRHAGYQNKTDILIEAADMYLSATLIDTSPPPCQALQKSGVVFGKG